MNLAAAIIGHMVGDYLLQNDWMAANKTSSGPVCVVHAALWTAAVVACGSIWNPWAALWLFWTHLLIDRFRLAPKSMDWTGQSAFRSAMAPWSSIVVDNTWHLVTILVAFWCIQ
jgi:hypothetical protein